jgi:hypothetical protein
LPGGSRGLGDVYKRQSMRDQNQLLDKALIRAHSILVATYRIGLR